MKFFGACLCCFALSLPAQTTPWALIAQRSQMDRLQRVGLTDSQRQGIRTLLKAEIRDVSQWCDDMSWVDSLQASAMAVGPRGTMLLEAGGCLRGAQGSNGSMWLVQWIGSRPILLGKFAGYPYRVLPQTSHGLHDVTIAWHMSARETYLTLYKFDGHRYREAGKADLLCDWDKPDNCAVHSMPTQSRPNGSR